MAKTDTTIDYEMNAVDSMVAEMKKQHSKKIIFCIAVLAIGFIITAIAVFVTHEETNGFKFGTNDKSVTADMILPNATLEIEKITNDKSFGNIYYYEADYTPNELGFTFLSLYNETHDLVSFMMMDDDINSVDTNYESLFNGVYGFEIDLINSKQETPNNSSKYSSDHTSQLITTIYNFDGTIDSIIITHNSSNIDNDEEATDSDALLLNNLVISKIGQYFVELSIKLGSNNYIGNEYRSISYITSYARYFWSICQQNDTYCNWDKDVLKRAVSLTNQIVQGNGNNNNNNNYNDTKSISIKNESIVFADDEQRRRLQSNGGCSFTWYRLGDGKCDSEANNAECNWDNGDCCESTCDNGKTWQAADDNIWYAGYTCGSGNGYNCLPQCNAANPSWLGDGYCDKTGGYNTQECNYDNGDCCQDTCKDGTLYTCGSNGYECIDNYANYCQREKPNCGSVGQNECLGLCGAACDCWKWSCGDCYCHGDCARHDTYCTCKSKWNFWCYNVFWVNCDDGSLAAL